MGSHCFSLRNYRGEGRRGGWVNATCAKDHNVLLEVVNSLAAELGQQNQVDIIRFVFLLPSETQDFRVRSLSGRLTGWKSTSGKQWPNSDDADVYLKDRFIVIASIHRTLR